MWTNLVLVLKFNEYEYEYWKIEINTQISVF